MSKKIRPIAIYLPQFHPIPENDKWWGKGFTEWRNVVKAKPLFEDHYQPHLPADLGFYDLRVPEIRETQAAMAKEYGIHGFCYYHYWFNGKRILERPFKEVLETGKPDFPFMLCWANENWTRVWDGSEKDILLKQEYSDEDHVAHIQSLIPAFKDKRYIRIDGKAVVSIYRSTNIPNIKNALRIWRNEAEKAGIQLYICRFESFCEGGKHYLEDGFDAAIRFEPISTRLESYNTSSLNEALANKLSWWYVKYKLSSKEARKNVLGTNRVDYNEYVDFILTQKGSNDYKLYPGITPMWDNSPRKKNDYFMLINSTPQKFREWMEFEINNFTPFGKDENLIFINAWNEWGEGSHLEPCEKWEHKYLKAVQHALRNTGC